MRRISPAAGVVAITGGGGGVGLAAARRFGAQHRIVLVDAAAERIEAAVAALLDEGLDVVGELCDVTDADSTRRVAEVAGKRGELRTLVHAAGLSPSMADAWRILDVNLFGTINVLDAFLPLAGEGTVAVCIASISGWRRGLWQFDKLLDDPLAPDFRDRLRDEAGVEGNPGRAYALSKRGVHLLVERAARDWGRSGARLVSVSPALIGDTTMGVLEAAKGASGLVAASALGRSATADDIAGVCELLASPLAAYITGTDLRVDGGAIAGYVHHSDPAAADAWDNPAY